MDAGSGWGYHLPMFQYRCLVILGALASAVSGWCAPTDEPVYGGVPLTTLLERAALAGMPPSPTPAKHGGRRVPDPNAENAVRNLDTNALPHLVQMLQDDSISRVRLAVNAFRLLGPKASPAVPLLEQAGLNPGNGNSIGGIVQALRYVETAALPALQCLSTNSPSRAGAIAAIMEIGKDGVEIQPIFVEVVKPGDTAAEQAVMRLRHYPATNAIPLLTDVLSHPQPRMRKLAAQLLREFGAQSRPAVPALIDRLYDSDEAVRQTAVSVLSSVAPEMFVTNSAPAQAR
ncbi:MAG: HEAT repeat domain-containing protein [Limisphaerales bacterium]